MKERAYLRVSTAHVEIGPICASQVDEGKIDGDAFITHFDIPRNQEHGNHEQQRERSDREYGCTRLAFDASTVFLLAHDQNANRTTSGPGVTERCISS